jgi:hypothetical protein
VPDAITDPFLSFTAGAGGNIDSDDTVDTWTINFENSLKAGTDDISG